MKEDGSEIEDLVPAPFSSGLGLELKGMSFLSVTHVSCLNPFFIRSRFGTVKNRHDGTYELKYKVSIPFSSGLGLELFGKFLWDRRIGRICLNPFFIRSRFGTGKTNTFG